MIAGRYNKHQSRALRRQRGTNAGVVRSRLLPCCVNRYCRGLLHTLAATDSTFAIKGTQPAVRRNTQPVRIGDTVDQPPVDSIQRSLSHEHSDGLCEGIETTVFERFHGIDNRTILSLLSPLVFLSQPIAKFAIERLTGWLSSCSPLKNYRKNGALPRRAPGGVLW